MAAVTTISITIVACQIQPGPGSGTPPQFMINTPQDGSTVSGAFFLSVQALDPSKVKTVTFSANGETQDVDFEGENKFRVFVVSGDFTEPEIELTATVTGKNGKSSSQTVTVTNESSPPSNATVTADGAILGSAETTGGTSLLIIPPGVGEGANVTFETRTQAVVLADTGVDYGALGVTFLGAQAITSDAPLDGPIGIASGGFAPMVPNDHTVVNYAIVPDADGDGKDELVVINTASSAPNGDVISDPVAQVQVGGAQLTTARGTTSFRTLQNGFSGPPGAELEIEVTGFNSAALLGNRAIFRSGVDDLEVEVPGFMLGSASNQRLRVSIPPLPPGPATITLKNMSTGDQSFPIDMIVEAPPALSAAPVDVINNYLDEAETVATSAAFPSLRHQQQVSDAIDEMRQLVATLEASSEPEAQAFLEDMAIFIEGNQDATGNGLSTQLSADCAAIAAVIAALLLIAAFSAGVAVGVAAALAGTFLNLSIAAMLGAIAGLVGMLAKCTEEEDELPRFEPIDDPDSGPNACLPVNAPGPIGLAAAAIGVQQAGGPSITGMGSGPPAGGDGCGNANGPPPSPLGLSANGNQISNPFDIDPGRIVIKALANGERLPFNGVVDAGGYFYVPLLPGGFDIEFVAIDTQTGDTRTAEVSGPIDGNSVFMLFDFFSDDSPPPPPPTGSITWDGGGDGSSWSDPLNWDTDTLPVPADDVVIDVAGAPTVVHDAGDTVVNSLVCNEDFELSGGTLSVAAPSEFNADLALSGGDLDGNGNVTANGTTTWSDGGIFGLGTLIVPAGATLEISGSVDFARDLDNAGTMLWTNGTIRGGEGATFHILPGGLFDIQTDDNFATSGIPGGFGMSIDNDGLVQKSAGGGLSLIRGGLGGLGGDGTFDVQTGTLTLDVNNTSFAGTITGAPGAFLGFWQGTLEATSSVSVPNFLLEGLVDVAGSFEVTDTFAVKGPVTFSAGADVVGLENVVLDTTDAVLDFSTGGPVSVANLTLGVDNATFTGSDEVTVTESLTWTAGDMTGSGKTIIPDNVPVEISGDDAIGNAHILDGRTFDNGGDVTWTGMGPIQLGEDTVFNNLASGVFDVQNVTPLEGRFGMIGTFSNAGVLQKTVVAGDSNWDVTCQDAGGTFDFLTGNIIFTQGDCP